MGGREVAAFVLGTLVGSFANVLIYRLPRREQFFWGRSRCPRCRAPIRVRDNIPLLSFLILRGRCRDCGAPIPWRYPLVELVTGALFALLFWKLGWGAHFVLYALFCVALVVAAFVDIEFQEVPDGVTLPGVAAGLAGSLILTPEGWGETLLGVLIGGGALLAVALAAPGKVGGGDVKLMAMVGAFLGVKGAAVALVVAVVGGGAAALSFVMAGKMSRKDPMPFAPFLAGGALVSLFWGKDLRLWYLAFFR